MKRKRSLRGWCGLGLAVAAVAGGAYAGKRYAEQHMLANVLGTGVRAESVTWHWRQAAGCAEQVEIPLPHATDQNDQALQLYAPKLWFVYDQSALLRKRFVLPRVIIEDAIISTNHEHLLDQPSVDIEFGPGVDLGDLVEMPSGDEEAPALATDQMAVRGSGRQLNSQAGSLSDATSVFAAKSEGVQLPWLEGLQRMCDAISSDKALLGQQVAIDTDMLTERIQAEYANSRSLAQKLITEARDVHQLLASMDNVLRQPRLNDITRRLEMIREELKKLRSDNDHSDKRLDEQQSRLRSALLVEKKQLLRQADEYQAPAEKELAQVILTQMVSESLTDPTRAVVLMADLMRKPLDAMSVARGEQLRFLDEASPEFAARSATISGKLEMADKAWPFTAQGSFALATQVADGNESVVGAKPGASLVSYKKTTGNSQWQMTIDTASGTWQLDGRCPRIDEPCSVKLTGKSQDSTAMDALNMACQVDRAEVTAHGRLSFRQLVGNTDSMKRLTEKLAVNYRTEALLRRLMTAALVVDDQAPEGLEFASKQLDPTAKSPEMSPVMSPVKVELNQHSEASDWLSVRLQSVASTSMSDMCRQAAVRLDSLVNTKLIDQMGLVATLRKDTDQFMLAQVEELRRIQASVGNLIEQMQPNYFARQPGETTR